MKAGILEDVQSYFSNLCMKNKKILHLSQNQKAFFTLYETVSANVTGKMKSPYVKVLDYNLRYNGDIEQMDKIATIGIGIYVKPDDVNESKKETARNTAERIMDEFIARMQRDIDTERNCALMEMVDFNAITAEPLERMEGQIEVGWKMNIPFRLYGPTFDNTLWTDTE
jgi:hypothetical protein